MMMVVAKNHSESEGKNKISVKLFAQCFFSAFKPKQKKNYLSKNKAREKSYGLIVRKFFLRTKKFTSISLLCIVKNIFSRFLSVENKERIFVLSIFFVAIMMIFNHQFRSHNFKYAYRTNSIPSNDLSSFYHITHHNIIRLLFKIFPSFILDR